MRDVAADVVWDGMPVSSLQLPVSSCQRRKGPTIWLLETGNWRLETGTWKLTLIFSIRS